ncbi:MAG TPA: hypothetical protein VNU26_10255 [Mycobacteriales bacterium]|nr:hypothetical protein [Mycobacteriales bacterium]
MSRSVVTLLLVLDVAAVVAVVRYLARWWRGGTSEPPVAAGASEPVALPTLTVLPSVAFVPPPRRERVRPEGLLSSG